MYIAIRFEIPYTTPDRFSFFFFESSVVTISLPILWIRIHFDDLAEERPYTCDLRLYLFIIRIRIYTHLRIFMYRKPGHCWSATLPTRVKHLYGYNLNRNTTGRFLSSFVLNFKFWFLGFTNTRPRGLMFTRFVLSANSCNVFRYFTIRNYGR